MSESTRLPLFIQISELLRREISAGYWLPGERLPTEAELAKKLGVAVGTLRKALTELESNGLLERKQGSGTYVKTTPDNSAVYHFFRLELQSGGGLPNADILNVERLSNTHVASLLGLPSNAPLWRFRRLRKLDQQPAAMEEIWIDGRHIEHVTPEEVVESLYVYYRDKLGFWISRVQDSITVGHVPDWKHADFAPDIGSACGYIERLSWSNHDRIDEVSFTWYDPEKVRYAARWT
ncbi:GntR family transcriptional regulator [Enterovibrio norvegicus FF-33]|uniref:GntR family transcriptional regulator n=1 Tax=Enterovibrio norvegicus FF-454 TaxID=1185651 RepID=A0A1E5BW50_9GAMM|nr:GntR family transcriptional regulator [Enterovibrio norvegicus]OEE57445.1 GntR family transcriptional regulator [Enterovibrio norvegicus FF-454]OEE67285.1 GntR family transcriptional regulator [Enterovibrio norvegicus FF-33]OEE88975.1 GntR family transcriptional regulator [Enterovibrio norvegicus FF-162]